MKVAMRTCGNRGFTLVELMVGMVSAGVLALVFSAVLFYGYKGWTRLRAEAAMETDANVAMRTMDRIGRVATNATWDGSTLRFYQTNGVLVQFNQSGSSLMQGGSVLIGSRVNAFTCVTNLVGGTTVQVNLRLVEGSETNEMGCSIFLRN
jgi:prepilin-type N-terminal cleavage/methylation domain-containing protein